MQRSCFSELADPLPRPSHILGSKSDPTPYKEPQCCMPTSTHFPLRTPLAVFLYSVPELLLSVLFKGYPSFSLGVCDKRS